MRSHLPVPALLTVRIRKVAEVMRFPGGVNQNPALNRAMNVRGRTKLATPSRALSGPM